MNPHFRQFAAAFTFAAWVFFATAAPAGAQEEKLSLERDPATGRVAFIKNNQPPAQAFSARPIKQDPVSAAQAFLERHGAAFGAINPSTDLTLANIAEDELGMSHLQYNQVINGVPVFGAGTKVHVDRSGIIRAASGRVADAPAVNTIPAISSDEAASHANSLWSAQGRAASPQVLSSTLYVYDPNIISPLSSSAPQLAWAVRLYSDYSAEHELYFISAENGSLLGQLPGGTRLNRQVYDCSYGDGYCYLDIYHAPWNYTFGRSEGKPARGYNPWYQYHYSLSVNDTDRVYDGFMLADAYLLEKFGRNGANGYGGAGDGAQVPSGASRGYSFIERAGYPECPNAFFDGIGRLYFCVGLVTADVMAHEYFHAVTHFTAGLVYQGESGALNESFSDIFGEAVEYYAFGANDWVMGAGTLWQVGLRSLANPTFVYTHPYYGPSGPYPDRFYSPYYYCGSDDHGGVHTNNGVLNHAAYLTAMGGSYNGCSIAGLGRDKEERIFYRALTRYLSAASRFSDAYHALLAACGDLYDALDCLQLKKALLAVELNQAGRCVSPAGRTDPLAACAALTPDVAAMTPPRPRVKAGKKSIKITMTPVQGAGFAVRLKITPPKTGKKKPRVKEKYYSSSLSPVTIRKLKPGAAVRVSYFYVVQGAQAVWSKESPARKVKVK